MRLLLTGGGTGGHVYPLLAVLEEVKRQLKDERLEVIYVGTKGGIEEKILKDKDIPAVFIYSGKWRRYWLKSLSALFLNFLDLFKLVFGFFEAFFILIRFRPEVILAKGGFTILPVVFSAFFCRIPIIIHESDIVMGISNKISSRFAKKICVSFPFRFYNFPPKKVVETGIPLRSEFLKAKPRLPLFNKKIPLILITGGSQGSQRINQAVFEMLPKLLVFAKVIHLTGTRSYQEALKIKEKFKAPFKNRYFPYEFLERGLAEKMAEADLIISRAGASTLAEIACLGRPSILIPLKSAAGDHQRKNAAVFEKNKASVVLDEDKLSPSLLFLKIKKIIKNKPLLREMAENVKIFSRKDAAIKIAEEVLKARS